MYCQRIRDSINSGYFKIRSLSKLRLLISSTRNMADTSGKKQAVSIDQHNTNVEGIPQEHSVGGIPPSGYKILGLCFPAYRSPIVQALLVSLVQLLVMGIHNVLQALDSSGQVNPTTSNNANTILYSLFAAFSLLAGSVTNYFRPKWTLATGSIGYSLLAASFWYYNHTKNRGFVYFAGAACGISAAFL